MAKKTLETTIPLESSFSNLIQTEPTGVSTFTGD